MRYFFDSSALAKLFLREPHSAAVTLFIERIDARSLLCSQLALLEVRSAIQRKLLYGETSAAFAAQALTLLLQEMQLWNVVPIDHAILAHAATCIDQHALRALDAIQLATSLLVNLQGDSVTFVAYDKRLLEAAKSSGLAVLSPADTDTP